MKNYNISVVCSDTTTFSHVIYGTTRKQAEAFLQGVEALFLKQGKNVFLSNIKLRK